MLAIVTNRDLYAFVSDLIARRRGRAPELRAYLTAMRALLGPLAGRASLDAGTLAGLLEGAFAAPAPAGGEVAGGGEGWRAVDALLERQIEDLRAMQANGTMEDEQRYGGTNAPGGSRWYNFDPLTYLECGVQGAFGGYDTNDEVTTDGEVDPDENEPDVRDLGEIAWGDVERFLTCGQIYE